MTSFLNMLVIAAVVAFVRMYLKSEILVWTLLAILFHRPERTPVDDLRIDGIGHENITALRLRALARITAALEAELLSMESDVLSAERAIDDAISMGFYEAVEAFQKRLLVAMMTFEQGSQIRVARRLSLRTTTLNSMLRRYGIDPQIYRAVG